MRTALGSMLPEPSLSQQAYYLCQCVGRTEQWLKRRERVSRTINTIQSTRRMGSLRWKFHKQELVLQMCHQHLKHKDKLQGLISSFSPKRLIGMSRNSLSPTSLGKDTCSDDKENETEERRPWAYRRAIQDVFTKTGHAV